MPSFSSSSRQKLGTCDSRLQRLFSAVVEEFDCTIIQGNRSKEEQDEYFFGTPQRSKVQWPNSKHNNSPSLAVDVAPYVKGRGIPWPQRGSSTYFKDLALFYYFAGYVMATAKEMGINLRFGGDWDRDYDLSDQTFDDLPHFEIVD